jgi:thiol-disulfide isomerase/thioredoxin
MKITHILVFVSVIFGLNSCFFSAENPYTGLPPGKWRAVLKLVNNPINPNPRGEPLPDKVNLKFEEVTDGELPFIFEVKYVTKDSFYIEIINGDERIVVDDIKIGRDKSQAKDTILINFPVFDSYIRGFFLENAIDGEWVVRSKENYRIPFIARHGRDYRFTNLRKEPVMDVSGRWDATFEIGTEDEYKGVGEFKQDGNHLTGTFLTETGDYRYLEGTVQANKLYLSCFDGSHAFLFEGKINPKDSTMIGSFRSGNAYQTSWQAKFNPNAKLKDANALTFLKPGYDRFDFTFENTAGKTVSLKDARYQNKVKIIQIMGTWCPNCRDETDFLVNYLKEHPDQDVEVIALAFERYKEKDKAMEALKRYQKHFKMDYELLLAGISDKQEASKVLPMLNAVLAYPTMIVIDKNDRVQRIHTGFSGPATSEYKQFKAEFSRFILQLLSSKSVQQ